MTTIKIHPPSNRVQPSSITTPLPPLLQTPSGLAILELQGSFNLPQDAEGKPLDGFEVGRVDFPDWSPDVEGTGWMNRVHLYVGQHQRLTGEVKKLPKALAVVKRRGDVDGGDADERGNAEEGEAASGDLEVVEIVKYKLMFSHRPEPVGTANAPA
jgi:chromosome transmission fidelity protein 8